MKSNQHEFPPGPKGRWFGLSVIPRLRDDIVGFSRSLASDYGDAVHFKIGSVSVFQFTHPDYIRELLVRRADEFHKPRRMSRIFRPWIGSGILLNDGPTFPARRRAVQAGMQGHDPRQQIESAVAHTRRQITSRTGQRVELAEALERVAYAVVTETVLGADATASMDELYDAATVLQGDGIYRMSHPSPLGRLVPSPGNRRFHRALRLFRRTLREAIARRIEDGAIGDDLLSRMLLRKKTEMELSVDDLADEAASLMFGGKETAGAAMTWTGYLLAKHPEIQRRVAEEVDTVVGAGPVSVEHLGQLPLLEAVFQEALRLFPAVGTIVRETSRPSQIDAFRVPRNSQVFIPLMVVHRDPRWFAEPEEFRPERFLDGGDTIEPFSYLPFGAGPHQCIGKRLATLEATVVLATILQKCQLRLADTKPVDFVSDMTLHPRQGLHVHLEPRHSSNLVEQQA